VQLWQPLGAGAKWYVAPSVQYGSQSSDIFSEGRRLARTGVDTFGASMVLGRELGNWGDLQFGATRQRARSQMLIPQVRPGTEYGYDTTHFVRYRVDTLDSLAFPSRGIMVNASIQHSPANREQPTSLASSSVAGMAAVHTTNWAGHVYLEWARAQRGSAPLQLGGFLRLSGTPADSVAGQGIAFGRVVLARSIGTMPLTLGGTVRLGFSLEAGGGYDGAHPLRAGTIRQAGSAFLSLDTRFGPAYLGAGATREGDKTVYLYLGPIW
jgi:NTE family protein